MTHEENPTEREPEPDADTHDADNDADGIQGDVEDDPAHSTDEDEGWTSEGGATPSGPATDVDDDA